MDIRDLTFDFQHPWYLDMVLEKDDEIGGEACRGLFKHSVCDNLDLRTLFWRNQCLRRSVTRGLHLIILE